MHFAFPSLSRTGCLVLRSGSRDIPRYEHAQIVSNYVSRFGIAIADDCLTAEDTRIECKLSEGKLLGFYAHVGDLSKVLIEGGHRGVFGRRGRGEQAVHEIDRRFSLAFHSATANIS